VSNLKTPAGPIATVGGDPGAPPPAPPSGDGTKIL